VGIGRLDDVLGGADCLARQEADRHAGRDALGARHHDHRRRELHAVATTRLVEVADRLHDAAALVAQRLTEVEGVGVLRAAQVVLDRDRAVERVGLAGRDRVGPTLHEGAHRVGHGEVILGDVGGVGRAGVAQLGR
jgi:hypothetical protein